MEQLRGSPPTHVCGPDCLTPQDSPLTAPRTQTAARGRLTTAAVFPEWSRWDSNPRPQHCERCALPTELRPPERRILNQLFPHVKCIASLWPKHVAGRPNLPVTSHRKAVRGGRLGQDAATTPIRASRSTMARVCDRKGAFRRLHTASKPQRLWGPRACITISIRLTRPPPWPIAANPERDETCDTFCPRL